MSTFTIAAAPELARIFPEARFVHSVRDGRDSGVSKVELREKAHHPTDAASGIDFWADRLRQAEEGVRGLEPNDRERLHLVGLDEIVWGDRERAYADLLDFLGVSDEPAMREFFEGEMTADAAHRGRWRRGLDPAEQREVTARYAATLDRLEREGYHCAPLLRRTYRPRRSRRIEHLTLAEHGEVIFVGGAAFSGTGLVARLLDAHPRLVALPIAARFHSDDRGMPALLGGRVGLDGFLASFAGRGGPARATASRAWTRSSLAPASRRRSSASAAPITATRWPPAASCFSPCSPRSPAASGGWWRQRRRT